MAYFIGFALAVLTFLLARAVGLDRDRAFYPTVLIVIASYYVLFAVMAGSARAIVIESAVTAIFAIIAVLGFKSNLWIVALALAAHGLFDMLHGSFITNPGVPVWWPAMCLAYDAAIGAALALVLLRRRSARNH